MLILVNPTYRNLSSAPSYRGPRFPFIGVRQFWRVLGTAGLISRRVAKALPVRREWTRADTTRVQRELVRNRLFLTNIVKCCYGHSHYPTRKVIEAQCRMLAKEIEIVQPKCIVAFGTLVFKMLTGKTIVLKNALSQRHRYVVIITNLRIPVIPCYFPIGRGNPKKAIAGLRRLLKK